MNFSFVLLYVENPLVSAQFYENLLGRAPVETAPGFAMIPLSTGTMLGLWRRQDVAPAAMASAGGTEIAFTVKDADAVQSIHDDWVKCGLPIAQVPTEMDFGHTCVTIDPDGHRLRVFAPLP